MKTMISQAFLQCNSCRKKYELGAPIWRCSCGGLLDVNGTRIFPKESLADRPQNFWRYREALALSANAPEVSLGEVTTPVVSVDFRGWKINCKLEYLLPTGSYKDRGIAVCMNQLNKDGVQAVAEDSSGNAGASVSAYAAAAGIHADIFVPETTSSAKVEQIGIYGAQCHLVPGTRTDCAREAQNPRVNSYYVGHSWNPLFACGIKSVAYEIAEQTGWDPPDWIVAPVGGGSLVLGMVRGFAEILEAGYITKIPKLLAVQAEACAPIYEAWKQKKKEVESIKPYTTCAEGVALPAPARGVQVLKALYNCGGNISAVNEESILSAWRDMAKKGIFMEPTSAVAVAGAWKAREARIIRKNESVLILITGHGLKTKPLLMNNMKI